MCTLHDLCVLRYVCAGRLTLVTLIWIVVSLEKCYHLLYTLRSAPQEDGGPTKVSQLWEYTTYPR